MREQIALNAPWSPLITIAIPTYNRASIVMECVKSALAQSYGNIEVLVSDNASSDNTVASLNAVDDDRLRVLTSPQNLGPARNFDTCVREAKGDYVVLVSDDNILRSQFIEKCVGLVRQEPGIPIVVSAYDVLVADEFRQNERRPVPARISKSLSTGIWQGTDIAAEYLRGRLSAQLLSSLIRTDILRRNGGYSRHPYAADVATWLPVLLEGRAGLINESCITDIVHGSSLSERADADDRFGDLHKVMEEISIIIEQQVVDYALRRRLQRLTIRYVAYVAMINLVIYRRSGASLIDVVRKLWSWRKFVGQCTMMDFAATIRLRSLGRILLPKPFVRWSLMLRLDRLL